MQALHRVEELCPEDPRIVPNPTNPCWLRCNVYKAFKMLGTCSHVITVTDLIIQARPEAERRVECDVQKMLMPMDKNKTTDLPPAASAAANRSGKALQNDHLT